MSWEHRGERWVYYRARRVNGRVVKEYCGTGPWAELDAEGDLEAREQRRSVLERQQAEREVVEAQTLL